jgi:hypothetical protein
MLSHELRLVGEFSEWNRDLLAFVIGHRQPLDLTIR